MKTDGLEPIETYGGAAYAYREPGTLKIYPVRACAVCSGEALLMSARAWRLHYCSEPCAKSARNQKARERRAALKAELER